MTQVFIAPVDGRKVRDPQTRNPLTAPRQVDDADPFWARRILSGDVQVVTEAKAKEITDAHAAAVAAAKAKRAADEEAALAKRTAAAEPAPAKAEAAAEPAPAKAEAAAAPAPGKKS